MSIHGELLEEEILPRLPVKSLLRFRCVSKSWLSLISSDPFVKLHHKRGSLNPKNKKVMLGLGASQSVYFQTFDSKESYRYIGCSSLSRYSDIVGSCNGLLCLLSRDVNNILVWNPSTGVSRELPALPSFNFKTRDLSIIRYGFGYDESTEDYKVFALVGKTRPSVLSLKTGRWRCVSDRVDDTFYVGRTFEWAGIFSNGALHWNFQGSNYIHVFDLSSEHFTKLSMPDDSVYRLVGENGYLVGENGYLCYISDDGSFWIMKEYGVEESWTKLPKLKIEDKCVYHLRLNVSENTVLESDYKKQNLPSDTECMVTYLETLVSPYC